ncbi:hypothetical protein GUJ93_ZPchr0662g2875 [Zizania palustris]|uniref:Uncharacterized protein n=1 Tax=Zizania palustris TaxID=103762 RepID=A0A8J5R8S3_ZIZPA|nr:hypothetical protein GUJ93_ZPchr0662g2875 [Zizania palustris]
MIGWLGVEAVSRRSVAVARGSRGSGGARAWRRSGGASNRSQPAADGREREGEAGSARPQLPPPPRRPSPPIGAAASDRSIDRGGGTVVPPPRFPCPPEGSRFGPGVRFIRFKL